MKGGDTLGRRLTFLDIEAMIEEDKEKKNN